MAKVKRHEGPAGRRQRSTHARGKGGSGASSGAERVERRGVDVGGAEQWSDQSVEFCSKEAVGDVSPSGQIAAARGACANMSDGYVARVRCARLRLMEKIARVCASDGCGARVSSAWQWRSLLLLLGLQGRAA